MCLSFSWLSLVCKDVTRLVSSGALLYFTLIFSLYTPAKLWIVLEEDNCVKLTLSSGIPHSVDNLKCEIRDHCGIEGEFRLRYMDIDFDQFLNLTSTDKRTVKVIIPSDIPGLCY